MKDDPLVRAILRVLRLYSKRNHNVLFTVLYNFIPAFLFAPYLVYVGVRYNLVLLWIMGVVLFVVDLAHFIRAISALPPKTD